MTETYWNDETVQIKYSWKPSFWSGLILFFLTALTWLLFPNGFFSGTSNVPDTVLYLFWTGIGLYLLVSGFLHKSKYLLKYDTDGITFYPGTSGEQKIYWQEIGKIDLFDFNGMGVDPSKGKLYQYFMTDRPEQFQEYFRIRDHESKVLFTMRSALLTTKKDEILDQFDHYLEKYGRKEE